MAPMRCKRIYAGGKKRESEDERAAKNLFKHENYIRSNIGTESTALLFICYPIRDALVLQFNIYG
jgi:hypothetical protein